MSYKMCLEKAGAKIIACKRFGSYQGEWYALVEYNGERGWVEGSYGSCSACDAFEAEFGWSYDDEDDLDSRYVAFGRSYLDPVMPHEQQLAKIRTLMGEETDWMYEDYKEVYDWMVKVGAS